MMVFVPGSRRFLPPRPRAPGLAAFRSWRRTGRSDLVAGVAVAAYLVPQCLAYARLAGLDPVTGLWTALPALVVYALLGTSRLLSVGPESASALLVASAVATLTRSKTGVSATGRGAFVVGVARAPSAVDADESRRRAESWCSPVSLVRGASR
jgi:sulfate permease, SulP family